MRGRSGWEKMFFILLRGNIKGQNEKKKTTVDHQTLFGGFLYIYHIQRLGRADGTIYIL